MNQINIPIIRLFIVSYQIIEIEIYLFFVTSSRGSSILKSDRFIIKCSFKDSKIIVQFYFCLTKLIQIHLQYTQLKKFI